ncbi:hypothetical protein Taro_054899 [Colocasia esculenta]|uniref:Uncharacterized protein n=1 Tax=Colocasia esculenta TaxID=4460 RepID=A0A843XPX1_COLES|nr:hypothetical protein [Colocasia esculenta]
MASKGASKQATLQQQQEQHQQIAFSVVQPSSSNPGSFMNKESAGAYDLGELDQALFLYLEGQEHSSVQEQKQTLNIFPSQPMHVDPSTKREGPRKGTTSSSEHEGPKTPDAKTLRRLAQNREAARKSRLRKKAYIQQLESSRIKLTQLEQELQRARAQGAFFGGGLLGEQGLPGGIGGISSGTLKRNSVGIYALPPYLRYQIFNLSGYPRRSPTDAAVLFDMEYARWQEDHHRLMCELRAAVQEHLQENELKMYVDNCLAHYDEMMHLKSMAIKSDVFHLVSGMWKTPAERCFMWLGGFRPSDLIKILLSHIEPLTEQQILAIYALRTSTTETEDALTQGLEALQQSLSDTIASDELSYPSNMANYMGQMAIAMNKLSTLEGFVRQADNLRQQTIHRLHQILTTRQAARCFLAIAEYFHRLRALSSLWLARPRQE